MKLKIDISRCGLMLISFLLLKVPSGKIQFQQKRKVMTHLLQYLQDTHSFLLKLIVPPSLFDFLHSSNYFALLILRTGGWRWQGQFNFNQQVMNVFAALQQIALVEAIQFQPTGNSHILGNCLDLQQHWKTQGNLYFTSKIHHFKMTLEGHFFTCSWVCQK